MTKNQQEMPYPQQEIRLFQLGNSEQQGSRGDKEEFLVYSSLSPYIPSVSAVC